MYSVKSVHPLVPKYFSKFSYRFFFLRLLQRVVSPLLLLSASEEKKSNFTYATRSVSGNFAKKAVFKAFPVSGEADHRKAWADAPTAFLEPFRGIISGHHLCHGRDDSPATVPGEGRECLSIREASGLSSWQF